MARNCGPYKKISGQICSILPSALAAGGMSPPRLLGLLPCCLGLFWGQKVGGLWQPVADTSGPYKKISDQICSILPWLLEA